ncbi:MAG: hypothetical protein WB608_20820 [Terracidiphilus sp.]
MRLPTSFSPIEVNEIDNFAFDFTAEVGSEAILSTSWSCKIGPFQTATDETPQARIIQTTVEPSVQLRSSLDGSLQTKTGFFSVATVGGFPISAIGATYILEATVYLSDGRILSVSSTVQCAP